MACPSSRNGPIGRLREISIPVNWTTVLVGLAESSPPETPPTPQDVIDFAIGQIAAGVKPPEDVLVIAGASPMDMDLLVSAVRRLAALESAELSAEHRKWRLLAVCDVVATLPADPLYALLALTEFWAALGFPPDMPHVVQGRGNTVSPFDYFTEANLEREVLRHRSWIDAEVESLRSPSDSTVRSSTTP